jgi:rhodanese-related sulfurtransferase
MPQAIDRKDVERLIGEGAQVVEVLPREEFEEDHLLGAISLPLRSLETEAPTTRWASDGPASATPRSYEW